MQSLKNVFEEIKTGIKKPEIDDWREKSRKRYNKLVIKLNNAEGNDRKDIMQELDIIKNKLETIKE